MLTFSANDYRVKGAEQDPYLVDDLVDLHTYTFTRVAVSELTNCHADDAAPSLDERCNVTPRRRISKPWRVKNVRGSRIRDKDLKLRDGHGPLVPPGRPFRKLP